MIAGKLYPQKANIRNNIKGIFPAATMLLCSLLLLNIPATSQTYYSVTNLSGTSVAGGIGVTVTSSGIVSSFSCSGISQPYVEGNDPSSSSFGVGSYTWSFSAPVAAVRLHIESINTGDDVSLTINGVPYIITASNISPLLSTSTCTGSTGTAIAFGGDLVNSGGGANSATLDVIPGYGINTITVQSIGAGQGVMNDFNFATDALPSFVNSGTQLFSLCQSSPAYDISSLLTLADADAGQTLTWSVAIAPQHGTTGGFPGSATSTGGNVTPTGLTYTPSTGFSGFDTIVVNGSDGIYSTTTTLVITVNPTPTLSSSDTIPAVCSGTLLSYNPTSAVAGTTFTWSRATVGGISNGVGSGTGNPDETLTNVTYYNVNLNYVYVLVANGCSDTQNVVATIKPTPTLSSSLTDTVCNGSPVNYIPMSMTVGTSYVWTRDSVTGIAPATGTGTGTINESLSNTTGNAVSTDYRFVLDANGCTSIRDLTVTVNPPIAGPAITTTTPSNICIGAMYQNFGTASAPVAGATYTWSASNATIMATGASGQYTLVSFNNSGAASVTVTSTIPGSSCLSATSYYVTVNDGENPTAGVIYNNYQFVYLDNTDDVYQWGYDNKSTLEPNPIAGANFQSYPDASPDFVDNYYWVMTTKGGCTQKTYYNAPLAVSNLQQGSKNIKLFPNPATSSVTVEIIVPQGITEVALTDMLGQTIKTVSGTGRTMQLNVADMPAGCYLVSCMQNGVRVATGRFIKN